MAVDLLDFPATPRHFSAAVQLTYHTDFALRVLIYLADRPAQKVTTREMAEFYGISLHHLTKVAKLLTKAGWVTASRGAGGGLVLAAHTLDAKVGKLVRFTEKMDLLECFDPVRNTCPIIRGCRLKPMLHLARQAFLEVLDGYTVRDLARSSVERAALNAPAAQSTREGSADTLA